MANYPKKMMDPTEAALSAIQEALKIRDDDPASRKRSGATRRNPRAGRTSRPFAERRAGPAAFARAAAQPCCNRL